jgi:TBC1 domain family protein 5
MKAQDNLTVNNPLSLETDSPWNQYFMDDNLRKEIYQDVERTFPEVEFFKDHKIK